MQSILSFLKRCRFSRPFQRRLDGVQQEGAGSRDGGPSSVCWGCCVVLQCFRLAEEALGVWFGSAAGREQCGVSDRPWQASSQRQERLKANGDPPVTSAGIVTLP